MALAPVTEEPVPIVWENTVVDIEPTSQLGAEASPDTASINTTLLLDVPKPGPVSFIAPGHWEDEVMARPFGRSPGMKPAEVVQRGEATFAELVERFSAMRRRRDADDARVERMLRKVRRFHRFSLELDAGRRLVRFFTRLPIIQEDDESYKFSGIYPVEFTELAKDGDFSVVVLLPRNATGYTGTPNYLVRLVDATPDPEPTILDGKRHPAPGERIAVSWYWRVDPILDVRYVYDRVI